MKPLTRRGALALGVAGGSALATGAAGLLLTNSISAPGGRRPGDPLQEPDALLSQDGTLEVQLKAGPVQVSLGGPPAQLLGFNGAVPGPTLRLHPGDILRTSLVNELDSVTNLHVHGLHVSPQGRGDNPFVTVEPGDSFDYEFRLPEDHLPGTYWYHPHHHGVVADQVSAGLYGLIIVEDPPEDPFPITRERVLVVSDVSLSSRGSIIAPAPMERMMGREGSTVMVNGQVRPVIEAAPGERERWRILNACTSRYLRLQLEGQNVQLLALDGGRMDAPASVSDVLLAPGNRAELLVTMAAGTSVLRAAPYMRGGMGAMMGQSSNSASASVDLAFLDVSGAEAPALPEVPSTQRARDLRAESIDSRRELIFSMGMTGTMRGRVGPGMSFEINGKAFDGARVDEIVSAGSVEEWTLTNTSPMDHPFHLHVWPVQVVEDGDRDLTEPTWQDVVNIPANGKVKILIAFEDFTGKSVFHCHVLDHEDLGMMGVIECK